MRNRPPAERPIAELAGAVAADLSLLARYRAELAKPSRPGTGSRDSSSAAGLFAGAGVLGYFTVFLLLVAAAEGAAALGLWRWLSYLLVAFILLAVAVVLAAVGRHWFGAVGVLTQTRSSVRQTTVALTARARPGGGA